MLENSVSSLRPNSTDADNLRKAHLIIWDEVSMVQRVALTVVNKLLQDIMQSQEQFGGKCILFGGDFRQILPVVRRGNRVTIYKALKAFTAGVNILDVFRADGPWSNWLGTAKRFAHDCGGHLQWRGLGRSVRDSGLLATDVVLVSSAVLIGRGWW